MTTPSAAAGSRSSVANVARALLLFAVCLAPATPALAQDEQAVAALGIGATHGSLSFAPWEQIDTFTGNVLLTFTDIDLPGNAGFNLTVRRHYNSKNGFFVYFDYGFPRVATSPSPGIPVRVNPIILMPDGSQVRTLQDPDHSTCYITTTLWRYDASARTLKTPNGVTYFYDQDGHPSYKTDAFGNRIDVVPDTGAPYWRVGSLVQELGNNETRTVSFGYGPNGTMTITANGRTWTYGGGAATDPTGATWTITTGTATPPAEYHAEAQTYTVTTPTGGWVRYLMVSHDECEPAPWNDPPLPPPPCEARWTTSVVRQRDTGGADITPATLTFAYQSVDAEWTLVDTAVTGTNGTNYWADHIYRKVSGPFLPNDHEHTLEMTFGPGPHQTEYQITQCTVNGQIEKEWVADHWEYLSRNWFPVVTGRTITQDGRTYTQQWTAMTPTFCQPLTVVEDGDFERTTNYLYQTFSGSAYLAPRPTSVTIQGLTTTMAYDANTGFMTSRIAAGIQTTFAPDAHGNVGTQTVINAQNSSLTQPTTFDHDWGVVSGAHTALSDVTMAINEDGSVHTKTQVGRTTQEERTTTFAYDDFGRLWSVQSPLGAALSHPTLTTYAPDHTWVQVGRGAAYTRTCVDGFGRTKATIATAGQRNGADIFVRTDTAYDQFGRVVYSSLPYEPTSTACPLPTQRAPGTTFEYDTTGRMTKRTNPDATYATMDYTTTYGQSPRVATTDERGHVTLQVFEASGSPSNARMHTFTDAAGHITTYGYDAPGNLASVVSPTQTTTPTSVTRQWVYDANNRLDHQTQPESGTVTYHYDGFGRLWYQVDALARQSTYAYDDENRLTDVTTLPESAYWLHVDYDEWGNRALAQNGHATTTFDYDADHRLTRRTDLVHERTFESSYQYDLDDQLTDAWYPSGHHVIYAYDHNRLTRVYDPTRSPDFAFGFVFHPSGGLASYTTGNGVVHTTTYDARYRTDHIGSRKTSDDDVLGLTYGYDAVGNVTSIQDHESAKSATFGYDALSRLETASQPGTGGWGALHWEYDWIGNRALQTKNGVDTHYLYTTANRLDHTTGAPVESFQYDAAGLLGTDGRGSYWYTPNNLQEKAVVNGGTTWYRYDTDGQRVRKVFGSEVSSTYYLRGPMGVLSEFEGAGALLGWSVDYIYAAGRLIATTKPPAGAWHTIAVTRAGSGTVTSSPTGLDCGAACTGRFTLQSGVTLTARPGPGQTFQGWGGSCGTGSSTTATVTVTGDLACTATFSSNPQLTLVKTGSGSGTVAAAPAGVSCGPTCAVYAPNATVTLSATADSGSRFAGWSGSCSGTSSPITVTMAGDRACTATFIHTYTLTVGKTGDGAGEGLVTSAPVGISCGASCSATYDTGTSVTLSADAAEGYEFVGWSGTGCTAGGSTVTVTMDQARSCTAQFAAVPPPGCGPGDESACVHDGGSWEPESCTCNYWWMDPLVIPLTGHQVTLTGVAGGVRFDVNGDGVRERVAWTVAGAPVGFLALDRNGNGVIDGLGELFGQAASGQRRPEGAANSFADLAAFDRPDNGGNGDGVISAADAVFAQLRLWVDANHDGVSQPGELLTLAQAGIASIELAPQPVGRRDHFGNYFRYRATVHLASGQQTTAWDVFLAARLNGGAPASAAGQTWPGGTGSGPLSAALAGLGASLVAVGLAAVVRPRARRRRAPAARLRPAVARVRVVGVAVLAAVLLWPAAGFGQAPQVVEYYDTDALGSVRAVTNAQGQVVARHDFLPFGEELAPQSPPRDKRLFAGQERDFETGQDYVNARQLRTDLGRFLAPDPMSSVPRLVGSQGLNAYAYVRNNPLGLVDPTGLDPRAFENLPIQGSDWSPTDFFYQLEQHGDMWFSLYGNGLNFTDAQIADMEAAQDAAQQNNTRGYETADAAGTAALDAINRKSIEECREYGGKIYRNRSGKYHYSDPVPGTPLESDWSKSKQPWRTTLVGIYHTHADYMIRMPDGEVLRTGDPNRSEFSADHFSQRDKDIINAWQRVYAGFRGYLGTPSGRFLFYDSSIGIELLLLK